MPCNSFFFNISEQIACCRDTDYIFISMLFPIYIAFVKHSLAKKMEIEKKDENDSGKVKKTFLEGNS